MTHEDIVCARCGEAMVLLGDEEGFVCPNCAPAGLTDANAGLDESIDMGSPFAAAREIGLRITDTDLRWLETRSTTRRTDVQEVLWCEVGAHEWRHTRLAGRPPRSCPDHSELSPSRTRDWAGATPRCFLLDAFWATRLFVNAALLRGAGWQLPPPIAAGLEITDELFLAPARPALGDDLTVSRRASTCSVSGFPAVLRALSVMEGDFVFVTLTRITYDVTARRRRELVEGDALGRLLWGCGIDPSNEGIRADPWSAVARALGGSSPDREALRQRLIARGNVELVAALDESRPHPPSTSSQSDRWPIGWECVAPLVEDQRWYAVSSLDGAVRVALGVVSGPPPKGVVADAAGVAWIDAVPDADDPTGSHDYSEAVVLGDESWVRWKRAEHNAVRASLAGNAWRFDYTGGEWRSIESSFGTLPDALAKIAASDVPMLVPPQARSRAPSPRSGFAYERLIRHATTRGLVAIEAAPVGISVLYSDGRTEAGVSLADVFRAD